MLLDKMLQSNSRGLGVWLRVGVFAQGRTAICSTVKITATNHNSTECLMGKVYLTSGL